MKTIKTRIGEVGFIETNDTYKNSIKKIPKGWRAIEDYEMLYLWNKKKDKIRNLLDNDKRNVWVKERIFSPVGRSGFYWFDFIFIDIWASRGVIVIKKGDGLK